MSSGYKIFLNFDNRLFSAFSLAPHALEYHPTRTQSALGAWFFYLGEDCPAPEIVDHIPPLKQISLYRVEVGQNRPLRFAAQHEADYNLFWQSWIQGNEQPPIRLQELSPHTRVTDQIRLAQHLWTGFRDAKTYTQDLIRDIEAVLRGKTPRLQTSRISTSICRPSVGERRIPVDLLIYLVIAMVVLAIVWVILQNLPLPPWARTIALLLLLLFFLLWLFRGVGIPL